MSRESQFEAGLGMRHVLAMAKRAANSMLSVLILGETGVGKDVLARAIHRWSPRAAGPMLPINCSALPATLVDAELFGHEKGAFTGATTTQPGLLEEANGGTVFLDEVGELPMETQAKLLRVVEERIVRPVGRGRPKAIDVRFLAATNRDIAAAIERGTFRADLFFRLGVVILKVPPLRDRRDEIPELARIAAEEATREAGEIDPPGFTPDALAWLQAQRWPGNIRELKNLVRRSCLMREGRQLSKVDLQLAMDCGLPTSLMGLSGKPHPAGALERSPCDYSLPAALPGTPLAAQPGGSPTAVMPATNTERERISTALRICGGNQTKAATVLGIARRTLITRLDRYNFPRPQKAVAAAVSL